jgi:hypothetical protein
MKTLRDDWFAFVFLRDVAVWVMREGGYNRNLATLV